MDDTMTNRVDAMVTERIEYRSDRLLVCLGSLARCWPETLSLSFEHTVLVAIEQHILDARRPTVNDENMHFSILELRLLGAQLQVGKDRQRGKPECAASRDWLAVDGHDRAEAIGNNVDRLAAYLF